MSQDDDWPEYPSRLPDGAPSAFRSGLIVSAALLFFVIWALSACLFVESNPVPPGGLVITLGDP